MKNILISWMILLIASGCSSCQDQSVTVGAPQAADTGAGETVEVDALADADAEAPGSDAALPADASDTDAAESDEIEADGADAGLPGSTCTGDPLVDPVGLGEPCTVIGALRCSDVGAYDWGGALVGEGKGSWPCWRPNALECVKTATGGAHWTLRKCNDVLTAQDQGAWKTCAGQSKCDEQHSGVGRCTLASIKDNYGYVNACGSEDVGKKMCKVNSILVCSVVKDNKVVETGKDLQEYSFQPLTCASAIDGMTYWFPVENCGSHQLVNCVKPIPSTVLATCSLKPDGEVRCDKNCAEYWMSVYKTPWGGP